MTLYELRDREEAIRQLRVWLPRWEFEFVMKALDLSDRQTTLAPPAAANREMTAGLDANA